MTDEVPVVAIDGPGGSGKGTISRLLARKLGWHWLDSGAIYRVLAQAAIQSKTPLDDEAQLAALAKQLDVAFRDNAQGESAVFLDDIDITRDLRSESCGDAASRVASISVVRAALLARQRAFRKPPGLVADGRDMGTVVFPDAEAKIFLTASLEERAKRRYKQLKEQGFDISIDALFHEIAARDKRDAERAVSPLQAAEDAITLDCSCLSIDDVLDKVLAIVRKKVGGSAI